MISQETFLQPGGSLRSREEGRLSSLNTNKLRARKDNIGGWCGERWVRGSTWASTLLKKKNIKSKCYYHEAALHITQMGL